MAAVDVYAITDKRDGAMLQVVATRLEARGRHARFQAMLTEYLDAVFPEDVVGEPLLVLPLYPAPGAEKRRRIVGNVARVRHDSEFISFAKVPLPRGGQTRSPAHSSRSADSGSSRMARRAGM